MPAATKIPAPLPPVPAALELDCAGAACPVLVGEPEAVSEAEAEVGAPEMILDRATGAPVDVAPASGALPAGGVAVSLPGFVDFAAF